MSGHPRPLIVGRTREIGTVTAALAAPGATVVEVTGEAGIGKTTVIASLAETAGEQGRLVLTGRAAEYERDTPLGVFVDALDGHLRTLAPTRLHRFGAEDRAALAAVFPALAPLGDVTVATSDRYRTHRAVRALLERLAVGYGLALVLEDLHWADPASIELVASLTRRPLDADVLIAVSSRSAQLDPTLCLTLAEGAAAGRVTRVELGPLSYDESSTLLSALPSAARRALYAESGGNPFYLGQLARAARAGLPAAAAVDVPGDVSVPAAVAASLAGEILPLGADARALLDGAAVAGEPFDATMAATVAGLPIARVAAALHELVDADLVRTTPDPSRFRFRHPLVRRSVYESSKAGWRLAAHARAAERLRAEGARASARARHVEQSAAIGDADAIATLSDAAAETAACAPATATRWLEAALRLVPEHGPLRATRTTLLPRAALSMSAIGRFDDGRAALIETLALVPDDDPARIDLITGCAAIERLLGRHGEGRARLVAALDEVEDPRSKAAVRLRLELTAHASWSSDFAFVRTCATESLHGAREMDDALTWAAATAALAFAEYSVGNFETARDHCEESRSLFAKLDDADLATRLEMSVFLGATEWLTGRFAEAASQYGRGLRVSRATGRSADVIKLTVGLVISLTKCGRVAEALEHAETAVEEARLSGSRHELAWSLFASCTALELVSLDDSLRVGHEAAEAARTVESSTITGGCGFAFGTALVAAGEAERAIAVSLELQGGEDLPWCLPGNRAASYEVLMQAELQCGRIANAARWARRAREGDLEHLPYAQATADRADAALAFARDEVERAIALALSSAAAFDALGTTVSAARSRILAGRAISASGDRDRAADELRRAEAAMVACGAERIRLEAARELRRIGRRISRRQRDGHGDPAGRSALSPRELEVVRLASSGETNRAIAGRLFVSEKTVESHMASAFVKLGVARRTDLRTALVG